MDTFTTILISASVTLVVVAIVLVVFSNRIVSHIKRSEQTLSDRWSGFQKAVALHLHTATLTIKAEPSAIADKVEAAAKTEVEAVAQKIEAKI